MRRPTISHKGVVYNIKSDGVCIAYDELPDAGHYDSEIWFCIEASGMYMINRKLPETYYKAIDKKWVRLSDSLASEEMFK